MVDIGHLLAVSIALGAAIASATQNLCIRVGTDRGTVSDATLIVMGVNLLALIPAILVIYYPDYGLTRFSWLSFIVAGLLGTLLGRLFTYMSIERIGASRTAPIVASWALIATVLGVLVLGEELTTVHMVGIVFVIFGVSAIAWETGQENPDNLSKRELLMGLLIPFAAALAIGVEPIFANFGFREGTPAPVGLGIKTVCATAGFVLYLRLDGALPGRELLTASNTKWFAAAGVGNTLFLIGYYVALDLAPVNVVAPIIVTNTLFVVLLSALFMPQRLETVSWRLGIAAAIVVVGVVLITAFG
ncbi:GRP family sugar transporter [Natronorubrum sp. FCH18a]|uniref:GRP family sugar transporter n=1 Tax=Natronorubrum sp. FCH18a TaxID=3447018 RepID=UPI003F517883